MNTNFNQKNIPRLQSPLLEGKKSKSSNNISFLKPKDTINIRAIDTLDLIVKIAFVLILATGGMLSLLEFINIVRTICNRSYEFGNSLTVFTIAFIATIVGNVFCLGFSHLIKITKHIYLNIEKENSL